MIRRIFRFLGSGIGITLMVAVALSLALWFLGGFLAFGEARPFDEALSRLVGLAVLWIAALVVILILLLVGRKRDDKLVAEIVAPTATAGIGEDETVKAELVEMRSKLKAALATLRRSKLGRRHLYELPWYIIIGPPGAGKTTAIVNSGLQFPLADDLGKAAVSGVGGTRNCDWWFTNNAVLVDTAGRYTTHESDAEADSAAWQGFLGLLKRYRKRQPINGAIVAISLSDLSQQDEVTQKAHAAAVRHRLNELRDKLGIRFPVYVLFTKADLVAGFAEVFESLTKEEREQVWGFTLPLAKGRAQLAPATAFDEQFGLLVDRLNAQMLERMQAESDPQRRSLIAGFAAQFASLRPVASDFLDAVFQESRFEQRQLLRGVYFTSGTQEGTPIDRLMMGMARTFGIGRQAIGSGHGTGRTYFLTRLFDGVIFREAGLVSADDKVERRYRWSQRAAVAAAILIALGIGTLWVRSYLGNRELIAASTAQIASYGAATAQLPVGPVADSDLLLVLPALDMIRALPGVSADGAEPPSSLGYGLYQGDVIGSEARQAYRSGLNQYFLPRLLLGLEERMQASINSPDELYEALKVYLMLGLVGPMDATQVKEWMAHDWEVAYPGAGREETRAALAAHLDALLSQPMQKIDLNSDLVTQVQGVLTQMPQAQRVYNGIVNSPNATALPEWRLTDIGGPAIARVFVRSSGKPLNEGIEGIYTWKGFNEVFLEEALAVSTRIQRDSWVLGPAGQIEQSEQSLVNLSRDVLALYYNDYIARYDGLLADIDIIPLESLSHAVEVTNVLSGPTSPIDKVLEAVAAETRLTDSRTPEVAGVGTGDLGDAAAAAAVPNVTSALSLESRRFLDSLTAASRDANGNPQPPGAYVEERFEWLQQLVERKDDQPSQLDTIIGLLQQVYQELNKLSFAGGVGTPTGDNPALAQFAGAVASIPGPLQRWAAQIAQGSSGITATGTRAGLDALWQANVLPLCEQATANAYPFQRASKADISMKDFAALFAPNGLIDVFFNENLTKFVDTRARPWAWKKVNDADLGISPAVLQQFQYAAEIRDAFFAGGTQPMVEFQLTPEALDPAAKSIVLEIDGQKLGYAHVDGQPRPTAITWPGEVGIASVTLQPPAPGSESDFRRDGPWALFRLLDAASIRKTNVSDRSRVIFNIGGRIAIFEMQSGSVKNPFGLAALSKFSCPKSF